MAAALTLGGVWWCVVEYQTGYPTSGSRPSPLAAGHRGVSAASLDPLECSVTPTQDPDRRAGSLRRTITEGGVKAPSL